ncbi:hypothetical protein [Pseudomonas monsensis]|uniref:hypothetical protein n=1 Tax=Pseudomonas monsensis TaxID=2745509 RepID=UPI003D19E6E8
MKTLVTPADLDYALNVILQDTLHDLGSLCRDLQIAPRDLLNQVAIAMARQFLAGTRDFHACDEVMNSLFSDIVDLGVREEMPEPAFSIYLAFDAGEHWHTGDTRDVLPWERWTRPELERILGALGDNQPRP